MEERLSDTKGVYPNPCSDYFVCDASGSIIQGVEVIDITGKVVIAQQPNAAFVRLETTSLSAGLYIVRILSDRGVVVCQRMEKV